jgi:hypothetical protein
VRKKSYRLAVIALHRELGGLMAPTETAVTWKLDPDFTWYELQISSLK